MIDLLVTDARLVDVITQRLYRGWFAVENGRFVEVEEGDALVGLAAAESFDAGGRVVQPGLIDTHMHIESSLLTPRRFAEAALPWGTTTVLQDPHEIANVLGAPGIRWMIGASRGLPLRIYSAVSSCVPATSAAIETPNATLTPDEVTALAREEGVLALGEMMDYRGVVEGDAGRLAMLEAGRRAGLGLEGHVPTLSGRSLSRYIAHGIRSDHTLMTPDKLAEELRKGLHVMLQEKSLGADVIARVMALPDRSRVLLITDDVMPNRLGGGHLSRIVVTAVSRGWDPLDALASASLRPATYLGLRDLGAIAPGYHADFLVCEELSVFPPERVYVGGQQVADAGRALPIDTPIDRPNDRPTLTEPLLRTNFTHTDLPEGVFTLADTPGRATLGARVIRVNDTTSYTTLEERRIEVTDGVPDVMDDLCLARVIARASLRAPTPPGRGAVGLVAGLGLRSGAFATTFAHDSHNLFVLGRTPRAMRRAARAALEAGGGMALVADDDADPIVLPLPLAGLLSDAPPSEVGAAFDEIERTLRRLGVTARNPVLLLTLLPLSVSPAYKLTDLGIVDVEARCILAPVVG